MPNNYSITFKSLRAGTTYVVNIGGGTGAAIPLKGGAQPFFTQEDESEDMYIPIRTQSGYIRIVDDGLDANGNAFDWKDLIPETDTARPVTLTAGGSVVWQGFMQAQDFGSQLYGNPQQREFPIQCVLTITTATDINYQQTAIQNFAYLLKQIVDSIPSGMQPQNFYIQGGLDAQQWLLKCIDWQNFVNEDSEGNLSARFNMYECLEDLCRFWGWTARTHGTTMYLTAADDGTENTWLRLTYAQLSAMAGGTAAGTTESFSSVELSGDIFASANNDDVLQRGYRKATVTGNGNTANDAVMSAFPPSVEKQMASGGNYRDGDVIYTNDITSFNTALLVGSCVSGSASFNKMGVGSHGNFGGSSVSASDGNWKEYNVIKIKEDYNGSTALASFETVYHHSFYDNNVAYGGFDTGGLYLNFDIFRNGERFEDADSQGIGTKHVYVRVGIGADREHALWYGGSPNSWSSSPTNISIRVGDTQSRTQMLSVNTNHANLMGVLFVDFMGSDDMEPVNGKRRFEIVNFSVEFQRRKYSWLFDTSTRQGNREYISTAANKVNAELDVNCIFASENELEFGYGVLMNDDGTWMTGYNYNGSSVAMHPEQYLANRVTTYWATSKRRIRTDITSSAAASVTPKSKVTLDNTTSYPISISHEWRDDITTIILLEL